MNAEEQPDTPLELSERVQALEAQVEKLEKRTKPVAGRLNEHAARLTALERPENVILYLLCEQLDAHGTQESSAAAGYLRTAIQCLDAAHSYVKRSSLTSGVPEKIADAESGDAAVLEWLREQKTAADTQYEFVHGHLTDALLRLTEHLSEQAQAHAPEAPAELELAP